MHTLNEQIALLKAEAEGREIEVKSILNIPWIPKYESKGKWDFNFYTYRIKPRMKRVEVRRWVNVYDMDLCMHTTKEIADRGAQSNRIACVELVGHYEVEEV